MLKKFINSLNKTYHELDTSEVMAQKSPSPATQKKGNSSVWVL